MLKFVNFHAAPLEVLIWLTPFPLRRCFLTAHSHMLAHLPPPQNLLCGSNYRLRQSSLGRVFPYYKYTNNLNATYDANEVNNIAHPTKKYTLPLSGVISWS